MERLFTSEDIFISEDMTKNGVNKTELEHILVSIFQSSYDGIYVSDNKGVGIMVNQAYSRITDVQSHELLGKSMKTVVETGVVSESVTMKVLDERTPQTIIQIVKGKELLVTGNPVFNQNGEITYVVTNVRDISDLNNIKTELYQSKLLTERYMSEIKEFEKEN